MIPIPHRRLSPEALRGVIEEFITREGTDYGEREYTLEEKVAQVEAALERSEAILLFDDESGRCHIATRREIEAARRPPPA